MELSDHLLYSVPVGLASLSLAQTALAAACIFIFGAPRHATRHSASQFARKATKGEKGTRVATKGEKGIRIAGEG